MAFKSLTECFTSERGGGRHGSYSPEDIVIATDRAGFKAERRYSLRIAIGHSVAKKARLIKGDRVDILFDRGARAGLLRRVTNGGWKLTSGSIKDKLFVKVQLKPGMPTIASPAGCPCEVTDDGIIFTLPDEVSFDRNMRAEAGE
jgi:hypothetical protein